MTRESKNPTCLYFVFHIIQNNMKYKTIHLFIAHCHSRCLISELCSESIFKNVQTRKMAPSARLLSPFKYQVIEMFMNTGGAILLH